MDSRGRIDTLFIDLPTLRVESRKEKKIFTGYSEQLFWHIQEFAPGIVHLKTSKGGRETIR